MNNESPTLYRRRAIHRGPSALLPGIWVISILLAGVAASYSGSATWKADPSSNDWNTASNWNPATVPNGPLDIATFAKSNTPDVSLSGSVEVNHIIFNSQANAFTCVAKPGLSLTISGAGISNNSSLTQDFLTNVDESGGGRIFFTNSASAGDGVSFMNVGGDISFFSPPLTAFFDTSAAGSATFTNLGGNNGSGEVNFHGRSTASTGTFINKGNGSIDFSIALTVTLVISLIMIQDWCHFFRSPMLAMRLLLITLLSKVFSAEWLIFMITARRARAR